MYAQNNPDHLPQINYFRTFPYLVLVFLSVVSTGAFATSAARTFVRHFNPVPLQLEIISVRARPGAGWSAVIWLVTILARQFPAFLETCPGRLCVWSDNARKRGARQRGRQVLAFENQVRGFSNGSPDSRSAEQQQRHLHLHQWPHWCVLAAHHVTAVLSLYSPRKQPTLQEPERPLWLPNWGRRWACLCSMSLW